MLQVRDLTKSYTTKGEKVDALDHVSLDFPETGMVFLLGRSGSGKSTLLNVTGGLDAPDEGEIIVKGKSSKDFTGSDFDSYRNTYVGFIFQEYNILNELTVGENVALALELQGKPRDKARIDELLSMVDMQGYADRKPNTLSGGQKQRVAIARALVKEPEIIMADEPTGALDSATGAQVFDTLKKLSKEKLVVIVSHDREFAETYADRIIELKDGKIVSDVTRSEEERERENVTEAGPKKLAVLSGAAMTKEDEARVVAFLRAHKGGILLSAEKEDLAEERKEAGTFAPTASSPAPREADTARFLPSRFPARYAFKMGFASLRFKPFRLVVTVFLAAIAFIVFGIFSTMLTYSPADMGVSGLLNAGYGAAVLQKKLIMHAVDQNGQSYTRRLPAGAKSCNFVEEEVSALSGQSGIAFIPVFDYAAAVLSISPSFGLSGKEAEEKSVYYGVMDSFSGFAEASAIREEHGIGIVAGRAPETETECMISLPVAEAFVEFGFRSSSDAETQAIGSAEELLGKTIRINVGIMSTVYTTVTGIFDAGEEFSAYDDLRTQELSAEEEGELEETFSDVYFNSMASVCFVSDGFYEYNRKFDAAEREYRSLLRLVQDNNGTTAYTEESESARRYQRLAAPLSAEPEKIAEALFAYYGRVEEARGLAYSMPYAYLSGIDEGQEVYELIFPVIGSAAGVLAVFAALLLFSFISASINAKKKEIGILRAVGARGIDVFKIFIVEGIAVTLLCLLFGIAGSLAACTVTNGILIAEGVLSYNFFLFGWKNALILLGIAAATALIATCIPVSVFSAKKPVEAIRSV